MVNVNIHQSWKPYLQEEFDKPYFKMLTTLVKQEYKQHKCFPRGKEIFNAFERFSFENTKVVIIGQDPYHGVGQANGLSFSMRTIIADTAILSFLLNWFIIQR